MSDPNMPNSDEHLAPASEWPPQDPADKPGEPEPCGGTYEHHTHEAGLPRVICDSCGDMSNAEAGSACGRVEEPEHLPPSIFDFYHVASDLVSAEDPTVIWAHMVKLRRLVKDFDADMVNAACVHRGKKGDEEVTP